MVGLFAVVAAVACAGDAGEETDDLAQDTAAAPAPQTGGEQVAMGQPPEGATQEMLSQGQQIFTGKGSCFTCHNTDAKGTPLAPDLTDDEWINIEGEATWDAIQEIVHTGVPNPVEHPSPMPPMGGAQLSDQEVEAVAAYVYSLSHPGGAATGT